MLSREAQDGRRAAQAAARALVALGLAAVIALAGCGEGETSTSAASTADTHLTLSLDADGPGGEPAQEATLTCPGDGGEACAAIDALPADPAAPTAPDQTCTQIYGGPDTLAVTGTLRGEEISAAFTRANGCEIERFDRFADVLAAVFPEYRGGTSAGVN